MAETITEVSLREETEERYLTYAMSVILSRALPDVRDGLKPVQRRILYTMYQDLHLTADGRTRKCAKIVGDVTGNYHPHGTTAAYEALARMAQNWVMRVPLVLFQGNVGTVDGDRPAAERYTEAKLAAVSETLMDELASRTVTMRPNYDNTREEPSILPAQFPNLLVNGSSGIAVGLATNIPPHNLGEVLRACILLIDDPEATTSNLLDKIKGPDFPLGGKVLADRAMLRRIYEEGTGSIKVQAEWTVEESGRKKQIIITSLPYGVDKGKLEEAIGEIIAERKLPQLLNLVNESSDPEAGIRIALEMKPDTDPNLVMAYLYKHTSLQETFNYNLTCLVPDRNNNEDEVTRPRRLALKEILRYFLDFRFGVVKRKFEFELAQLKKRIHILEGFRIIFNALDEAIRLIRESSGKADAATRLINAFQIDDEQATAILDAQLYKIAQMEIKKILEELKEKKARAKEIESILASDKKLWNVVKEELQELEKKDFARERRHTKVGGSAGEELEFDASAYVVDENTNVVLTRDGWIKRVGRLTSVESTRVREGDEVIAVAPGSTKANVIFLADDGTAYTMRINDVTASTGYGDPITKFFRLGDKVRILTAITDDRRFTPASNEGDEPSPPYLLVATAQGQVLRTPLGPFRTASTKAGRRYVRLNEGDRVVLATVVPGDDKSMFLASAGGRVIHFPIDEVNILAGVGKGVIGIKLDEEDVCLGGQVVSGKDVFSVEASDGRVMEFRADKVALVTRGGKGHEVVKRKTLARVVPLAIVVPDWANVESVNGEGQKTLFE
jgi:DNA gyrase subunit A